jgi:spore coat protein U domain-containing protein, fimbrial subunit CupE1/2/3/6
MSRFRSLALVALLALPGAALAECSMNVIGVSFGSYDTFATPDTDITGSIAVNCDATTSVQISLSAGFGPFATRHMQSGPSLLFYNLYTDPSRLTIWGDGSPGTSLVSFSGTAGSYTVYGRIPARQNVPVGTYDDTITVTLTF